MQQAFDFLSQDPILFQIIQTYGLPQIPRRPPGFATLVLLILEQQVSIDSAKATFNRIKAVYPNLDPAQLVLVADEDFRSFGVSRQKTAYIKGLAQAVLDESIVLESLAEKPEAEARKELLALKGIGNWTVEIYLMFALASPDILPLGDIAIVNAMRELYEHPDKEAMEAHAQNWKPYRSYAAFLLWHHYLKKRNRTIDYQL